MSAVIAFALPFMLKHIQKPMSNAKKTHHIIQLVTISAELKQPELPIMYCSRPLESVEQILFHTYMEVGKATSKNGVKAMRQESFSDTMDSKPV